MEEKCKSCSIDDVGCSVIKQLRKEVLKIKVHRSYLHIIALFICVLGLFIAGLFATAERAVYIATSVTYTATPE